MSNTSDLETFARLVLVMRSWQKQHARDGSGAEHCRTTEKQVDAAVEEVLSPTRAVPEAPPPKGPCDHSWTAQTGGTWRCPKCGTEMSMPPRGTAGAPEKPPPNTEGTP